MNRRHAPQRCDPRAIRIAQVKFVALPLELTADSFAVTPAPDYGIRGQAPSGAFATLFTFLRTHIIRVIGRLEAARP